MLFNSYIFIFAFLPAALLIFYRLGKVSHRLAALWLVAASLFFYGWWNSRFVGLLLSSVAFNYAAGYLIGHRLQRGKATGMLLAGAISVNLMLLGYFKYANFFLVNVNALFAFNLPIGEFFCHWASRFLPSRRLHTWWIHGAARCGNMISSTTCCL